MGGSSQPNRRVGTLLSVTTKEHPCHVYSDSMPSQQIIGQIIEQCTVESPVASMSSPTAQNTLNGTGHVTVSTSRPGRCSFTRLLNEFCPDQDPSIFEPR